MNDVSYQAFLLDILRSTRKHLVLIQVKVVGHKGGKLSLNVLIQGIKACSLEAKEFDELVIKLSQCNQKNREEVVAFFKNESELQVDLDALFSEFLQAENFVQEVFNDQMQNILFNFDDTNHTEITKYPVVELSQKKRKKPNNQKAASEIQPQSKKKKIDFANLPSTELMDFIKKYSINTDGLKQAINTLTGAWYRDTKQSQGIAKGFAC